MKSPKNYLRVQQQILIIDIDLNRSDKPKPIASIDLAINGASNM
jgi:hypothetical protein